METNNKELNFLPIAINITNKKILIIGGGKVGYHKATIITRFTQNVTVISPEFHEGFNTVPCELIRKKYDKNDLKGFFLIYICTENRPLNKHIKQDAENTGLLASVCDDPVLCDFVSPAIYKEDNISIAVSSDAQNVHQSIHIRNQIRELAKKGRLSLEQ